MADTPSEALGDGNAEGETAGTVGGPGKLGVENGVDCGWGADCGEAVGCGGEDVAGLPAG
ncbi:MAG: hypothetical protein ABJC10_02585 [Acidobacteriota bacterium]